MSYIEYRKSLNQYYFVKQLRMCNRTKILKKYIGSKIISKGKYLLDNLDTISHIEFEWRKQFLPKNFIFSNDLLEKNELLAIQVLNVIEGRNNENEVFIEFAKEFIYNSNRIEGSRIPLQRVREIIETGDASYSNRNEVKEVQNSILALEYVQKSFRFNIKSIKKLYSIIVKGLFREGNLPYPKGFKTEENVVGNSPTTHPDNVEEELQKLLDWYLENKKKEHPLFLAFEFHRRFEKIHPFEDGNGRTGRMILNKILLCNSYPPIIVFAQNTKAYFESFVKREKYLNHFLIEQSVKSYQLLHDIARKY